MSMDLDMRMNDDNEVVIPGEEELYPNGYGYESEEECDVECGGYEEEGEEKKCEEETEAMEVEMEEESVAIQAHEEKVELALAST